MLYSNNPHEILLGCARVSAWAAKQSLPIAVEVTASMQRELNSPQRNVSALSLALIRFINGVVEPFKNANIGVSISTIGASYGVPDFVVTLRHSATHGKMPTFEFAALGAKSALDWLKENYWEEQLSSIEKIETQMKNELMDYFLKSIPPFSNVKSNIISSFGLSELVKLTLNPSQNKHNISPQFQSKVAELLTNITKTQPNFAFAYAMKVAEEVGKGNEVATCWLEFLNEHNLIPMKEVSLLFQWCDPSTLGRAIPMKLIGDIQSDVPNPESVDVNFSKLDIKKIAPLWPPTSIGNLPETSSQSLTMTEDEFEFVEPGECIVGDSQGFVRRNAPFQQGQTDEQIVQKREPENLLEIW
ncbi:ribosomal biogenesis protein LAS1L-like isoform X2 [Histomonas meleagridis]|uniref:ribosomal biogenesis protein LAS1L-like isoform X2 n=1 Tax=Histomonas meleagridis TaxID=135588 RepID=UPI00355969E8|nr:ribosomal biogenesis protein LAS1L-like isoform X2 [Histomonas meleagridis]KAH0807003.1 ribosomal biogenesis protein LAS1L-like isoform X2 [Histomonas meleagridis]